MRVYVQILISLSIGKSVIIAKLSHPKLLIIKSNSTKLCRTRRKSKKLRLPVRLSKEKQKFKYFLPPRMVLQQKRRTTIDTKEKLEFSETAQQLLEKHGEIGSFSVLLFLKNTL